MKRSIIYEESILLSFSAFFKDIDKLKENIIVHNYETKRKRMQRTM